MTNMLDSLLLEELTWVTPCYQLNGIILGGWSVDAMMNGFVNEFTI
jgi:hypothetical protein